MASSSGVYTDNFDSTIRGEVHTYANAHVLTAVCPASGAAVGLVAPRLDTGVVQSFLEQLSAKVAAGVHAVLVWDGAGHHSASKALRCPANLTVVTLPPYSPELNPVERL